MQIITESVKDGNTNAADSSLPLYTNFWVMPTPMELPFFCDNLSTDDNCAISAILDKDGNEIATNRRRFIAAISFGKKLPENGWYTCLEDKYDIPELKAFYDKYCNYEEYNTNVKTNIDKAIDFTLHSAYVNKAEHLFIPHEIAAVYKTIEMKYDKGRAKSEETTDKIEYITINATVDGFELIELNQGEGADYPRTMLPNFQGTNPAKFDDFWSVVKDTAASKSTGVYSGCFYSGVDRYDDYPELRSKGRGRFYYMHCNYEYQGEDCTLLTVFAVKPMSKYNRIIFAGLVGAFTLFTLIIALLYSWRRNVLNKADYAFEDYQKDLTNNLAHDLKTPLAAIGGYAENLMEFAKGEKQQKYLRSILDNVAYTDSMISKTLALNTGTMQKLTKSKFDMHELADTAIAKYKVQLEEKGIMTSIDGNMEVYTDNDMMTSAIENLVSNAVKYTRNDGNIKITMNKRKFEITNDVSDKIDTRDLTKPFVRGDKNRSGRSGSGLGLSIADKFLTACGFVLELECTDEQFTAVVRN